MEGITSFYVCLNFWHIAYTILEGCSFRCLHVLRYYTIDNHHHIHRYNFFSFSYALLYWIWFSSYGCWCSQFCSAGFLWRILLVLLVCWRVVCWRTTDWLTDWLTCFSDTVLYVLLLRHVFLKFLTVYTAWGSSSRTEPVTYYIIKESCV